MIPAMRFLIVDESSEFRSAFAGRRRDPLTPAAILLCGHGDTHVAIRAMKARMADRRAGAG